MIVRLFYQDITKDLTIPRNGSVSIGSDVNDTVCISSPQIEKEHAVFFGNGNGKYYAEFHGECMCEGNRVTSLNLITGVHVIFPEKSRAYFTVIESTEPEHELIVKDGDTVTIGKLPDNDICIRNGYISRHHAEIVRHGQKWRISDCGSKNGLYVNGKKIKHCEIKGDAVVVIYVSTHKY